MLKSGLNFGRVILAYAIMIGVVASVVMPIAPAHAATGINQQINFQGRLFNAQGATVPDGYYNIQFKIYQDGDGQTVGNTTGSPAGSLKWTESWINQAGNGVMVKNGFISVQLGSITPFGSSVDWDQDTLWLSMNIGNTNVACTPFASCSPDGEMTPMKRLSATPYALNAGRLGGLTAAGFIQNQNTSPQAATNYYIDGIGKAATGLQGPSLDTITTGTLTIGGVNATAITLSQNTTVASGKTFQVGGNAPTATQASIQSSVATNRGLTIQGASGQTADLLDLYNSSGNFLAGFSAAGKLYVNAGINLGTTTAAGAVTLKDGTASGFAATLNSSALTANQTVSLGDESGTVCLRSSANCGFATGTTASYIQNQNSGAQTTSNFWISGTGQADSGLVTPNIRAVTDGISAVQIQNAAGTATILNIDTTNKLVGIGTATPNADLDVSGSTTQYTGTGTVSVTSGGTLVTGVGTAFTTQLHSGDAITVGGMSRVVGQITSNTQLNTTNSFSWTSTQTGVAFTYTHPVLRLAMNATTGLVIQQTASSTNPANSITILSSTGSSLYTIDNGGNSIANGVYTSINGTFQSSGGAAKFQSGNSGGSSSAVTVTSGNATGGTSGNVTVDTGTASTTTGTVEVGTANASAVTIGRSGVTTTIRGSTSISAQTSTSTTLLCTNSGVISTCDTSVVAPTASNFIQNQNVAAQATANYWISGTGKAVGGFQGPSLDTIAAGTLGIGNSNATSIDIATNAVAHAINIGTGGAAQTITIGSLSSTSTTSIQGGSNGVSIVVPQNSGFTYGINNGASTTSVLTFDGSGRAILKPLASGNALDVKDTSNNSILSVDTSGGIVGAAYLTSTYGVSSPNLSLTGSGAITYTTPLGSSINTKISITNYDPGAFNQIIALGLPSNAASTARAITLLDARATAHQPTIAVLSPNENQIGGFSYDGSNTTLKIKNSSTGIALNVNGFDALTVADSGSNDAVATLGVGSSKRGQLSLMNATNNNSVTIQASTTSGSYLMSLPTAIGTANQCLNIASVASNNETLGYSDCLTTSTGVQLQAATPGTQQTGNLNISGVGIFGGSVQSATLDTPSGTTTLNIGTTNATTGINLNQSAVLAASKSLTITGSGTRPGAPAEGMLYFDTTTKQLQVYSNGKWQADSKTAAFIVAASDSTQSDKDGAQYIADGENSTGTGTGTIDGDQTEINLALNAAAAAKNGTVYLAPGTYTIDQPIQIPNNVTLAGSGEGTVIQLGNFGATTVNIPIITNVDTSTGTGVTIRDLQLDGRKDRNSSGFQAGIYFEHMGASGRVGGKILNIHVRRMVSSGVEIHNSGGISITNSTFESNSGGIYLSAASNTSVVGNTMWGNFYHGIDVESASQDNAFSANAIHDNNGDGILVVSSTKNSFSNNTIQYNGSVGVELLSANDNSISSNTIHDNANNGIVLTTSNNNAISSNRIQSSGGSTKNDSIWLATSDNNTITSNQIGDNAYSVSNYAINISNSGSDKNYLADNTFSSTAGNSLINDAGTNTIWSNQSSAENGSNLVIRDGSSTSAFDIQNASGASLLTMDTVNSTLNLASAVNVNGIAAPGAPAISLTSGGSLAYSTTYRYRLAAVNAIGRSNAVASSPVSVTTAGSGTTRTATVTWTVVPDATAYYLYRSTDGGTTWYRNTVPGGGGVNTTTDTGASYTWSGTNYASDIYNNTSAIVNINNNGQIAFNSGNATINTSAVTQDLMISNYAAAKGIVLQGDYLTFMDTTGYATNFTITNTGATTLRNRSDSTAAFQIQNALNTSTAFMVDTSNSRVRIGSGTAPAYPLDVTGDVNTSTQYRIGGNVTLTNSALTFTGAATATVQSAASQALNLNGINNLTVQTNSITRATFDTANTLYLGNGVTAAAPSAFKISGTGSTTTAVAGGALTIQGGNATVGSANGGNVTITGGTGLGTGAAGLVVMSTPTFSTTANDANCYTSGALVAASCTITAASVNNSSAIIAGFNVIGQTATLPDPTIATAGRVVYITAANGSSDFTLSVNGGGQANQIAMRQNTTATMIWNGADWTAAGASSSTTLQSAYDNTLQSAGGAELIVSKTSTTNGLTIRDSTTAPVNGTLLTVQTSSAAGLFSVNSNVTEYASDAGAEVAGGTPTTFPASTWSSLTGTTASRYITAGDYIATGQGSVSAVTTAVANTGVKDQLTSALSANSTYNVSFTTRLTSGTFTDMNVYYSIDGTAASSVCTTAATSITSIWTKVNCTFTTPASGITSSNAILIRQTAGAIRTFYVDNLSVTIAADYNFATDGDVGDSANFATNWPTAGLGTVTTSRITSDGNDASDSAQAAVTAGAVNAGIRNKLSSNPLTGTLYRVTVYGKLISGAAFTDFKVRYSYNGNTTTTLSNYVDCVDYNTQTLTTTGWTKVTCYIKTDANAATNPHVYFAETTSAVRTFAVDTFSMTLATITTPNVQVGGGINGGPTTLFTLDKGASAPIASNNDALLGSMYYDTTLGKLQCYEADGWGACGSSPDNIVTISPEYTNAVLHGTGVGTMTSDLCSDGLNLNDGSSSQPTICGTNETYNFYKWTSPQSSAQTYSIFVTYQLPTTFKSFASGQTSLMGRTDSASSTVQYQVYRNTSTGLTACGSTVSVSTGVQASWKTQPASGASDPSTCGFAPSDSIVFKIDVIASSNANAYVGNLNFTFSNR